MTSQRFPGPSALGPSRAARLSAWTPTDEERAGWGRGGATLAQEATESETGKSGSQTQKGRL